MIIILDIPNKRITDLLHGHSLAYSHWLHEWKGAWNKGLVKARFDREADEEGQGKGRKEIGTFQVQKGLHKMAIHSPESFADFMDGRDDDLTADVAIQYIIFGKLVYG